MIEELGIEEDVIILGWVEENDLPHIFNRAEIFIFPSLYEGFGMPVIQAMACGVPVISSNIEVLREVAQEAALFFDCHNSIDLAQKIELIQKDKNLKEDLIKKGLIRCQNFSWEKCAQETLNIINNL
jgi:glycosyltransferase involved in cell wall biosynthesis